MHCCVMVSGAMQAVCSEPDSWQQLTEEVQTKGGTAAVLHSRKMALGCTRLFLLLTTAALWG